MSALFSWAPRDGETIHLARGNAWQLPSGRYTLKHHGHGAWDIAAVSSSTVQAAYGPDLQAEETAGRLTPISEAELERDRRVIELRTLAPLRGNRRGPMRAQHDASDLALFRAVEEPGFAL